MMISLQVFTMVATIALSASCIAVADDAKPSPSQSLDGVWQVVAANLDGVEFTGKDLKQVTRFFVFAGHQQITIAGDEVTTLSDYTVDISKTPHTLTTTDDKAMMEPRTKPTLSIFKMENDRLTICSAYWGSAERPKDFSVGGGKKGSRVVLQRARPIEFVSGTKDTSRK